MNDADHDELEAAFEERVRKACPEVGVALHWTEKSRPYLNVWKDEFHVHIFLRNGTCEDPGDLFVADVEHAIKMVRSVCGLDRTKVEDETATKIAKMLHGWAEFDSLQGSIAYETAARAVAAGDWRKS